MPFTLPWLQQRRRQRLLAQPFPPAWRDYAHRNAALFQTLSPAERTKLQGILRVIVAEKTWEGCGGLAMTEEIQVTVAAQAGLLLLGWEPDYFPNVESILVYPAAFTARVQRRGPGGIIEDAPQGRAGEASGRDWPVVLSWADVLAGGRRANDGRNVVLHEFAHKLDLRDGAADGVPRLAGASEYEAWAEVMSAEYEALVAQSAHGEATLLDAYGATDPGEFFAVATECFFERPGALRGQHERLYGVLRDYYRQDPAQREAIRESQV